MIKLKVSMFATPAQTVNKSTAELFYCLNNTNTRGTAAALFPLVFLEIINYYIDKFIHVFNVT